MTLEELLALLPDNTTGQISAGDMRAVVTGIWDQGAGLEARIAALETGGGGGPSVTGRWQVNPQAGAVPGGTQVTCDTGQFATASWLRFSKMTLDNVDMSVALLAATAIYGQQEADATSWARFTADTATDAGSYVEVAVAALDSGGSVASAGWQNAVFSIQTGAAS